MTFYSASTLLVVRLTVQPTWKNPLTSPHQIPGLFQVFPTEALIFINLNYQRFTDRLCVLLSEYCGTICSPSCACQLYLTATFPLSYAAAQCIRQRRAAVSNSAQHVATVKLISFFTCDSIYAIAARICHANSVCLSVRLSATRVYCIKTAERVIEILSPSDRPIIPVFRHQGSLRKSDGFTPNGGAKYKGVAISDQYAAISRKGY